MRPLAPPLVAPKSLEKAAKENDFYVKLMTKLFYADQLCALREKMRQ